MKKYIGFLLLASLVFAGQVNANNVFCDFHGSDGNNSCECYPDADDDCLWFADACEKAGGVGSSNDTFIGYQCNGL